MTDPRLAHMGAPAILALSPHPGERVLDVGCGAGATTRELARLVAPTGEVTGIDISQPLLRVARARGGGPRYVQADACTASFEVVFDKVFSRFGVMFFEDPVAAFANLRRAAPRGRLAFVCWRSAEENPAMTWPLAAVQHLLPQTPPTDADAPGPFAFADRGKVERILRAAGWVGVNLIGHDSNYMLGATPREATAYALTIGPLARALRDAPDRVDEVRTALEAAFAEGPAGKAIEMPAATWVVSAA